MNTRKAGATSRGTGAAFALVAFIVVVAGAAAACTTFKGKLTVTGNGSNPGSVSASGRVSSMNWCSDPAGTANVDANTSGTVGVTVAAAPSGLPCLGATLPSGTYDIRWTTGTWDGDAQSGSNCMSTTDIGDISVSSSGTGSATSGSFNPGGGSAISVCVTNSGATFGNQVPLSVV